jgi:hypothetical protein
VGRAGIVDTKKGSSRAHRSCLSVVVTGVKGPDEMEDEDELELEQTEIGNRNRALWKKIGRSVASNVRSA